MRYYYTPQGNRPAGEVYICNHPLYNSCTLYREGELGLAVIQQRFNSRFKCTWWGPIDMKLSGDIYQQEGFREYFLKNSSVGISGIYPTVEVRKIMWALRMKPLIMHPWETKFDARKNSFLL
jgi:hypothetical protein